MSNKLVKRINGKLYSYGEYRPTKVEAQYAAKKLREKGHLIRVLKGKQYSYKHKKVRVIWELWVAN